MLHQPQNKLKMNFAKKQSIELLEQAKTLRKAGQFQEAINKYRKGFEFNPKFLSALERLGNIYSRETSTLEKAAICYQRILDIQPNNISMLMNLGSIFIKQEKYEYAIEVFNKILALDSKTNSVFDFVFQSYITIACHYQSNGQNWKAFKLLEKLLEYRGISLSRLRDKLNDLEIRQYVVPISEAGLGDQLVCANVASKICDCLGLNFSGVCFRNSETRTDGYWRLGNMKMNFKLSEIDSLTSTDLLGISQIPTFSPSSKEIVKISIKPQDSNYIISVFDKIHKLTLSKTVTGKILQINLPVHARKYEVFFPEKSCFKNRVQENFQTNRVKFFQGKSGFNKITDRGRKPAKILFHLRLGDVACLDNLIPGKLLSPWIELRNYKKKEKKGTGIFSYENAPIKGYAANRSFTKVFTIVSKVLKKKFKQNIHIGLITDGFDTAFEFIKRSNYLLELLKSYNENIDMKYLSQKEKEEKENFYKNFEHIDSIIYGEDKFCETIESIIDSDILVTCQSHFSFQVSEFLSPPHQKRIIFDEMFTRANTFLVCNPIDSPEVSDEIVNLVETILKEKQFEL